MKKNIKNKKAQSNIIIKIISIVLIVCGVLSMAGAVFFLIYGSNVKESIDYRIIGLFGAAAALLLSMGVSEIITLRKNQRNLFGLITGFVALIALIVFMTVGITTLSSSGFEFIYILIMLFSPAVIITILYIKALMKDYF